MVGVADDGERVGIPEQDRTKWDGARIGDLVEKHINPERVEVAIFFRRERCPEGTVVIEMIVPQHPDPPLVICIDGKDQSRHIFRKGAVLVRNNTKVEPASRADFVRWKREDRRQIFEGVQTVVLNPGSTVHITKGEETLDPTSYFFSRSVDLFRQRPDKLLDGKDLMDMFTNRDHLDTGSTDRRRLLIHSALRRQATLWFWLALLNPTTNEVTNVLYEALEMKDRDKSDMSRAMALVGSVFLAPAQYRHLIARMEASRYAHIQRAAGDYATVSSAKASIAKQRNVSIDGRHISEIGDEKILAEADLLIEGGQAGRIARLLPRLGLEYFTRQLSAGHFQ